MTLGPTGAPGPPADHSAARRRARVILDAYCDFYEAWDALPRWAWIRRRRAKDELHRRLDTTEERT